MNTTGFKMAKQVQMAQSTALRMRQKTSLGSWEQCGYNHFYHPQFLQEMLLLAGFLSIWGAGFDPNKSRNFKSSHNSQEHSGYWIKVCLWEAKIQEIWLTRKNWPRAQPTHQWWKQQDSSLALSTKGWDTVSLP